MAVALKNRTFNNPRELCNWVADAANSVTTIVSIVYDAQSGKHVLYYT